MSAVPSIISLGPMGTLLLFTVRRETPTGVRSQPAACEIIIFPGVRIERQHAGIEPQEPTGSSKFLDGAAGRRRSRKSS